MTFKISATPTEETVEEFLARGGRVERIEHYPDPDGRVVFRAQGERQQQFAPRHFTPPLH